MTATVEEGQKGTGSGSTGRVARVTGPVVDVEFPTDAMPEMYNKLEVELELGGETKKLILEVALHIGDGMVRAISMQSTDGLVRGASVIDTGESITVPVGDITKGHVFNATGDVLNLKEGEQYDVKERWGIARLPRSTSSSPRPRCSRPASRSSTCSPRTVQGGKIGLFGGAASARPC